MRVAIWKEKSYGKSGVSSSLYQAYCGSGRIGVTKNLCQGAR